MQIEEIAVKDIKPYERNAKKHDERQVKNVMESIKAFGFAQPLVIDKYNVLIIGHCRLIAAKRLKMPKVPCVRMENLSDDDVARLRLLDNKLNESEWDFDLLSEDVPTLDFSDFDIDWNLPELDEDGDSTDHGSLADKFIVPPFSVLDTKQGYWQDRKKQWLEFGIKSEVGRNARAFTTEKIAENYGRQSKSGVSVFDPVLTEIMYKWFCPSGGGDIRLFCWWVGARYCC